MADSCSCNQTQSEESFDSSQANLLDGLIDLISDIRPSKRYINVDAGVKICQDSSSENDSDSDGSSDDDGVVQRSTESIEELHKELTRLEISEEATTLETLIIIVEFYVKSGDIDGFRKNVRRPDKWLLTSPRPQINDVKAMALNLEKQNLPFRALMMYKAICALYKYEYEHHPSVESPPDIIVPNEAITGIEDAMEKAFELFISLHRKESSSIYLVHFIPILYDMLTNLREIRHADRKYRADCEAWGLLYISIVHGKLGERLEMRDVIETNTKTLERRFKKKAERHLVYGISLITLVVAKQLLLEDCAGKAMNALKALQESKGMPTWEDKVKLVSKAQDFVKTFT